MSENILTRALDILRAVAVGGPRRFGELRVAFGINQTTLGKILMTLTERGYLQKGPDGYELGETFHSLAEGRTWEQAVREAAHDVLRELSGRWGVTALLIVHEARRTQFLDKAVQDHTIFGRPVGQWFPQSAALPWDLHWMRQTCEPDADALFAEANAFWAERNQPRYTEAEWREIFADAGNIEGCMSLSPGFPCEARGAVPLRLGGGRPVAYLGFIAIADRKKHHERLEGLMRYLSGQAQAVYDRSKRLSRGRTRMIGEEWK